MISVQSLLARVALRSSLLAFEDSVNAERDRLLGELDRYKMGNEQFKR